MPAKVHTLSSHDRKRFESSGYALPKQRKPTVEELRPAQNAIARFDQARGITDEDRDNTFRRVKAAAKRLGFDIPDTHWQQLGHQAHY